ncbi:hypothetical protein IAR55_001693 [Kwoniella newhampshirensis]|uniref:Uncharacterized protein n=1 Tax=Kwoniella newhampshirensis TaxID=1651941 RepID=A0AAW0Z2Q7_9TREE
MPAAKIEKEAWNDEHTTALIRGMVVNILTNRSDLYKIPDLQGVSDNGGDRVNKKVMQILKKLCGQYPGAEQMVDEEVKKLKGSKSGSSSRAGPATPKKRKMGTKNEDE